MSTTSPRTSSAPAEAADDLRRLIEGLPERRAEQVYTHASWASDRASSYERLEFLGDSVLELAVARALYDRYPEFTEGRLAKVRSHVVSRQSCAVVARQLELGNGAAGGGAGRALPRARLRADRTADRGRVRPADRVRAHEPRRLQDGAPGGAGAPRAGGLVRGARGRRAPARPPFHVLRRDRRGAGRRRRR
ncbi:MAG: hypothetical protein E6J75_04340 [Deltaproteobacteria bacterium]|nr:MAG: hypothetical protein E6J75_04340 [Deltaproteobacteria bacterium]